MGGISREVEVKSPAPLPPREAMEAPRTAEEEAPKRSDPFVFAQLWWN
jgi:hypothetical protein